MAREIKQTLLDLIKKHNQLYKFTTRGNLKTNSRRVKEGRKKSRTRKMKRMSVNIDKILSSISPSYKSGGLVNDLDLNKVQLLQLRQVKWIKAILRRRVSSEPEGSCEKGNSRGSQQKRGRQ